MTKRSAPIHWRNPSTSAAHCSWVNGGLPTLEPDPRASKTTTRKVSASLPKLARGSARDPSPGAPWCAISTGAPASPSTSTSSSLSLMVTRMRLTPGWKGRSQGDDDVFEAPGVRRERVGAIVGDEHAVGDAEAGLPGDVDARLVGDDHPGLEHGVVAVLQPRRLVHPQADAMALAVPDVVAEPGGADDVQAGLVDVGAARAGPQLAAAGPLRLEHDLVVAALPGAWSAEEERALALHEPAPDRAAERQHERVAGPRPVPGGERVGQGAVGTGVHQPARQHRHHDNIRMLGVHRARAH